MSNHVFPTSFAGASLWLCVTVLLAAAGCGNSDPIVTHRLPKVEPAPGVASERDPDQAAESDDRMLVGILLNEDKDWYFKLVGKLDAIEPHVDAFRTFLKSVKFQEDGPPKWEAPDDWQETPGNGGMRVATFAVGDPPLELAVTSFRFPGDSRKGLLMNVNRWRGQMNQPDIDQSQVDGELESLDGASEEMLLMDVTGSYSGGMGSGRSSGARSAPFANRGAAAPAIQSKAPAGPASRSIEFDTPDAWKKTAPPMFASYAFETATDDQQAKVTVSAMTSANKWEPNVTRWKDQVGAANLSDEETEKLTNEITVDGNKGRILLLESPEDSDARQAMAAAMVVRGDQAWFFKLIGDHGLVMEQQEPFKKFLQSVKFK